MRTGVGVDLVEVHRIAHSLERSRRFLPRVFGPRELALYRERGEPLSFLAANFAAKEAFAKALGTGVRGFALQEVETLRDKLGRPYFHLSGSALRLAGEAGLDFAVSLSHTREYAIAFVVATPAQEHNRRTTS